jgi:3'(2'), 5'-bisphosphate nucleotidase
MTAPMNGAPDFARQIGDIARAAGDAILSIYHSDFAVETKADASPLTAADLAAQQVIMTGLAALDPVLPVLSEEAKTLAWSERRQWSRYWLVDPLDGTREFVKRNGEFTVNIALIVEHEPVLGVVAAPAQGLLYWGAVGVGAFSHHRGSEQLPIHISPPGNPLRVVGSRSHASVETTEYLEGVKPHVITGIGSSLKFCLVAEGKADLYPRFGPTSEWDTAAGQALLEAAGGHVTRLDGHRLRYNCRETLVNGDFLAFGHPGVLAKPKA